MKVEWIDRIIRCLAVLLGSLSLWAVYALALAGGMDPGAARYLWLPITTYLVVVPLVCSLWSF